MVDNTLTKADVVTAIYERQNQTRNVVKDTLEILLRLMKQAIKKDGALLISGFGKFEEYSKNARKGRNPAAGDGLMLPPRRVAVFRVSKTFRAKLKNGTGVAQE